MTPRHRPRRLQLLWLACLAWLPTTTSCAYYRVELRPEKLGQADAIVVPGMELTDEGRETWILWNRMLMARALYEEGHGQHVIVSGGVPKRGVTEAQKMLEIGERLGIPREVMHAEPLASSSVENARFSARLLGELGCDSALVVTDRAHLIYALPVFRDAYRERGIELFWKPVDYERLQAIEPFWEPGAAQPPRLAGESEASGAPPASSATTTEGEDETT